MGGGGEKGNLPIGGTGLLASGTLGGLKNLWKGDRVSLLQSRIPELGRELGRLRAFPSESARDRPRESGVGGQLADRNMHSES